jgi:hypothetical protein
MSPVQIVLLLDPRVPSPEGKGDTEPQWHCSQEVESDKIWKRPLLCVHTELSLDFYCIWETLVLTIHVLFKWMLNNIGLSQFFIQTKYHQDRPLLWTGQNHHYLEQYFSFQLSATRKVCFILLIQPYGQVFKENQRPNGKKEVSPSSVPPQPRDNWQQQLPVPPSPKDLSYREEFLPNVHMTLTFTQKEV